MGTDMGAIDEERVAALHRQPSFLLGGVLLVTGEVPRTTAFEIGLPPGHQARVAGQWQHGPLVDEDQALVAHVRGRGLVVITGCGHADIVRQAKRLTGVDHRTSWLAHHALYDAMPQAYRPNSVGSRFELRAAPETNVSRALPVEPSSPRQSPSRQRGNAGRCWPSSSGQASSSWTPRW